MAPMRSAPLRKALESVEGAHGVLALSDVLEQPDGMRAFRFACVLPEGTAPVLELFDSSGKPLDATVSIVADDGLLDAHPHGADHALAPRGPAKTYVLSATMASAKRDFHAIVSGAGSAFVTSQDIQAALRHRDAMMVNPSLDERYPQEGDGPSSQRGPLPQPQPLISVVTPVYKTPIPYLKALVESMGDQTYGRWEHVLVNASPEDAEVSAFLGSLDDDRFKVVELPENQGISLNTRAGIEAAQGSYVAFVDHDDVLEPCALEEFARAIAAEPDAGLLYCDEDSISEDGAQRHSPMLKPSFNPDLFASWNYLHHMLVARRDCLDAIELPGRDVDGSQDYDLGLKLSRVADAIVHVPKVLYHWRAHGDSINGGSTDAKPYAIGTSVHALGNHFASLGIDAVVTPSGNDWLYRVDYPRSEACDVALVVSNRDDALARDLLGSLASQRTSILREVVMVGGSPEAIEGVDEALAPKVRFVEAAPEDGAAALDRAIAESPADVIVHADCSVAFLPSCDALGRLRDALVRDDLGIVSAKAMARDGLSLHAGLCVKDDGAIGYLNQGFFHGMGGGYNGYAESQCDYSAVDSLCMAFRKADFLAVGGISEDYARPLARAVDFSFRIRSLGKLVMVDPYARVEALADPDKLKLGASHLLGTDDLDRLWSNWDGFYREDVLANPSCTLGSSFVRLA